MKINLKINGENYELDIEPRTLLVYAIRELAGLTGTHVRCDTSSCGACTVLIDGKAIKSCTLFAIQAEGAEITTVEGLTKNGELHPIQHSFKEKHGLQCGFCTPGMIMLACDILENENDFSESNLRRLLKGNLCRCTGYQNIIDAIAYAKSSLTK